MDNNKDYIVYAGYTDSKQKTAGAWKTIPNTVKAKQKALSEGYTAFTTTSFEFEPNEGMRDPNRKGDLILDIDCNGNFSMAVNDTRLLLLQLEKYGIDLNSLPLYASGGKGFHIYIPATVLDTEHGSEQLPSIYKMIVQRIIKDTINLAERDGYSTLLPQTVDMGMYCFGKGRLLRHENTPRDNGKYKVPIKVSELFELQPDEIKELTSQKRHRDWDLVVAERNEFLSNMVKFLPAGVTINHKSTRSRMPLLETLENNCAFIKHCVEDSATITEPEWFMAAKIYGGFDNIGKERFVDISRGYEKFSEDEAEKKFDHARQYVCPECKQISEETGFICPSNCPTKGTPYSLIDITLLKKAEHFCVEPRYRQGEDGKNFIDRKLVLKRYSERELQFIRSTICSYIEVVALSRSQDSRNWGIYIEMEDKDHRMHKLILSMAEINSSDAITRLYDEGITIEYPISENTKLLKQYLMTAKPEARAICSTQNGWNNDLDIYILYDKPYGKILNEIVVPNYESRACKFEQKGTLKEWSDNIAIHGKDNSFIAFVLSVPFCAPLLRQINMEGFFIHLFGRSSHGKTTLLTIANSVTGEGGNRKQLPTWCMTANGGEGVAAMHNDNFMVMDEIGQADSKTVSQVVYKLANGEGKTRANISGDARERKSWTVCVLSSGEHTLADKVAEDGKISIKAGQIARFHDIEADAGKGLGIFETLPHEFENNPGGYSVHLKSVAKQYYGTAYDEFMVKFTKDIDANIEFISCNMKKFQEKNKQDGASGQVLRVMEHFSVIATAGELAIRFKILPYLPGRCNEVAALMYHKWVENRGGIGDMELENLKNRVIDFIRKNSYRFQEISDSYSHDSSFDINNFAGYKWKNQRGNKLFLVDNRVFKSEILGIVNASDALHYFANQKMLACTKNGSIMETKNVNGKNKRGLIFDTQSWLKETNGYCCDD